MKDINSFVNKLKCYLPWSQPRIANFAQMIVALLKARSCNLKRIADEFQTGALLDSNYRRIKRFFTDIKLNFKDISRAILEWLNLDKWALCIDRTNWKYSQKNINYLVISVIYQGSSVPLCWQCLDKKGGNSNASERIALMEQVLEVLPASKIESLVADREFIGEQWLNWLKSQGINYHVRLKDNVLIPNSKGHKIRAVQHFYKLKSNTIKIHKTPVKIGGILLYVSACKTHKGVLIIASTLNPDDAIAAYQQRWCIEVLFGNLKSRGFDLEQTRMTQLYKMDKLMALLAVASTG